MTNHFCFCCLPFLQCEYCNQDHLDKVDQFGYRKMTKLFKKVGCGPIRSCYKNYQRPIANLDATQSFVYGLKPRFCKWRTLIGQHFCQAFLQKDKNSQS